ncbi:Adenosine (5')-pentaphospho-(5'')-adenosine pyrophosphohydrolase [hydrothermal vent metagenome]|uniref:Adenosine (5')-pentaphospho-(5'')-adenosine pyrophosphohydrolase n=1 Tax=hydrothermal vent metagenome TaxID=652676 RepID=A0A3B1BFU9_9ZZZZ
MIDADGYRANVGIILSNADGHVLWARRIGQQGWQFPQGGIKADEDPLQALYRELHEEVGLQADQVEVVGNTRGWLRYRLPKRFLRHDCSPMCIGQKQIWYLLRLQASDQDVCLDLGDMPEFDSWRWVDYWQPLREVIAFKRDVYRLALEELAPLLSEALQRPPRSILSRLKG